MAASFHLVFNRMNRQNANGQYTVNIQVVLRREVFYLTMKHFPKIEEIHWDPKHKRLSRLHPHHYKLNQYLDSQLRMLEDWYADQLFKGIADTVTKRKILDFYNAPGNPSSFYDFFSHYVQKNKKWKYNTKNHYKVTLGHLKSFQEDMTFSQLDQRMIQNFLHYLENETQMAPSTIHKQIQRLKTIVKRAYLDSHLTRDPFDGLELKLARKALNPIRTLRKSDIATLIQLKLTAGNLYLDKYRDLFVFQCLTGLYKSDIQGKGKDWFDPYSGQEIIHHKRAKNGRLSKLFVAKFPWIYRAAKKWYDQDQDLVFPQALISDQNYNEGLKVIARLAKIDETGFSNKIARKTFANLLGDEGIGNKVIQTITGHSSESVLIESYLSDMTDEALKKNLKDLDFKEFQ